MKFQSIIMRHFKGLKYAEFKPKNTIYAFLGPNGSGKTSRSEAIRYALTGSLPDNAIRSGSASVTVEALLEDGTSYIRNKNEKGSKVWVNGRVTTAKSLAEHIEKIAGASLDGLKLATSADVVENLKPSEFGSFIMSYIPEELDYDTLKTYMGVVDSAVYRELEKYISKTEKFGYDDVTKAFSAIFEQRKLVKKEVDKLSARMLTYPTDNPEMGIGAVNKRLEEIAKKEGETEFNKLAIKTYEQAVKGRELQQENIKKIEAQIAAITATKADPLKIKELNDKIVSLTKEMMDLNGTIATFKANIKTFEETIENLNNPVCPLSEGLVCNTDKTSKKEEFVEKIESNKEGVVVLEGQIAKKQAEVDSLKVELLKLQEQDRKYREKIVLNGQLEAAKKAIPVLPEKPAELAEVDYTAEKNTLYKVRDKALACIQRDKDKATLEALTKDKETLDTLVALFAPKGKVMQEITKFYFGVFEEICNERAKTLKPDFELKFEPNDGINVLCKPNATADFMPYHSCSSGERAFVLFLLMDLINELTQTKIMILDDLDKLDDEAFASLLECITQEDVIDAYDHIILCAVNHEDTIKTLKKYPVIETEIL